jgi:hypothetical protein
MYIQLGNKFPAVTTGYYDKSQSFNLKLTVEIILLQKTQFLILSIQFDINGSYRNLRVT